MTRLLIALLALASCCSAQDLFANSYTPPYSGEYDLYAWGYSQIDVSFTTGEISAYAVTNYESLNGYGDDFDVMYTDVYLSLYNGSQAIQSSAESNCGWYCAETSVYGQVQVLGEIDQESAFHFADGYDYSCDIDNPEDCTENDSEQTQAAVGVPYPPNLYVQGVNADNPDQVQATVVLNGPVAGFGMSVGPIFQTWLNSGTSYTFTFDQNQMLPYEGQNELVFTSTMFGQSGTYHGGWFIDVTTPTPAPWNSAPTMIQTGGEEGPGSPYSGGIGLPTYTYVSQRVQTNITLVSYQNLPWYGNVVRVFAAYDGIGFYQPSGMEMVGIVDVHNLYQAATGYSISVTMSESPHPWIYPINPPYGPPDYQEVDYGDVWAPLGSTSQICNTSFWLNEGETWFYHPLGCLTTAMP